MRRAFAIWWWWRRRHAAPAACPQITLASSEAWDSLLDGEIADATGYVFTLLSGDPDRPEIDRWTDPIWTFVTTLFDSYTSEFARIRITSISDNPDVIEYCAP